jgi:hypothetical protein
MTKVKKTDGPEEKKLDVEGALSTILDSIKGISDRLTKLEESPKAPARTLGTPSTPPGETKVAQLVPHDYLELVRTILNPKFQVELDFSTDTAEFLFSVLVPEEYSNAGKPHWDMYHEDRRTRKISNALGVNGVREWVQKIYESFDMEIRSRITQDRMTTF